MKSETVSASSLEWQDFARIATLSLASRQDEFTSNDIWQFLSEQKVPAPVEPKAMGPVTRWAIANGIAEPTSTVRKAAKSYSNNHGRPQLVYRSLVMGLVTPAWPTASVPSIVR